MSPDIELDDVTLRLGGRVILDRVSLSLSAGRTAVIGANGSGKSSFARLLNGLLLPSEGSVRVGRLDPARDAREIRRRVGFIFANPEAQILMPTPAEDVALSLRDLPRAERADRVAAVLAEYGLGEHADVPVSSLSGGQRQLLAVASVLATEPALLVADEPTTLLDLRNAKRIGELLLERIGLPLVLVTHDLELAARCDQAVLFDEGRVVAVGAPDAVIAQYRERAG